MQNTAPSPLTIREFRSLLPIAVVIALGFGLVIPVLPIFARDLGAGIALVGIVQFVFGLTRFSFGIAGGLVVDRFGERASTVVGILIVAASSFAAGFAQSFPQLVVARGFGGAGSALFIAGMMNRVLQVVPRGSMGRATAMWRTGFLVGIGIGPALGGVLGDVLGNRAPFHIYGVTLLIAATIAWTVMASRAADVPAERRKPLEALRAARPLFGDIRYVVALLATLVGWWTISGPGQFIGAIFAREELGFSRSAFGFAITLLAAAEIVVVLLIAGPAADRFGRRAVLLPSLGIAALATALIGQVEAAPLLFFPLMVALGAGIAASSAAAGGLLADAVPTGGSGTAVGVNQMSGDLGYMIAPPAIGAIAQGPGFGTAYVMAAIPAAAVFLVALRLPGRVVEPREKAVEPLEPVG